MPIDAIQSGEVFTVRTYKVCAGFGWANTYEVQAVIEPPSSVTAIENLASAFAALEQAIHTTSVTVDRVVVSTYVPDGLPYNPSSFTSIPFSVGCNRSEASGVMPLEVCLFVRRNVAVGRDGRLLYRGCLTEDDVVSPVYRARITPPAITFFQTAFATWFTNTFPATAWNLVMARGVPSPTNVRAVLGLQVSEKVAIKKLNNRYFDRP